MKIEEPPKLAPEQELVRNMARTMRRLIDEPGPAGDAAREAAGFGRPRLRPANE